MSDKLQRFRTLLAKSKDILVLSGAGVSAESGIPTFRDKGGYWRTYRATDLATPQAFARSPGLVWEFYHFRRELVRKCSPNSAHLALAQYERLCQTQDRRFNVVTQNVDGLHQKAGSQNVLELHGALRKVSCTQCHKITVNEDSPICEALRDRGIDAPPLSVDQLPRCGDCGGLLRPFIVWFGENLDAAILDQAWALADRCDLFLVVGTSSVVYPAAMFAPHVAQRGVPVVHFNIDGGPRDPCEFYFDGACGTTLPAALSVTV